MAKKANDLRSQLKATPIKKLQKRIDEDNTLIGANSNEYLNLEDGRTLKIRVFPAHPGAVDFYIPKKSYWLTVAGDDGEPRRTTVNDSKVHGGTEMDLIEEYVKMAKAKFASDTTKLDALTSNEMSSNSLRPSYSWICYADIMKGDDPLRPKLWEFKKMVRDAMNKLAFSEDEDDVIEVDPFTDVDDGLPIMVKYMRNPNRKKGENYYDVSFPMKSVARPLTDEEIEFYMTLPPLNEVVHNYSMYDFEKALDGLQWFDEEHEMGLFEDEDWLNLIEEVKAQYEADDEDEPAKKKPAKRKKTSKKVVAPKVEEEIEEEVEEEIEEEEAEEPEVEEEAGDKFDDMDRRTLRIFIRDEDLGIKVFKSMSDDDIRNAIREAVLEVDDEEIEEEEVEEELEEVEETKGKVSIDDIRKKLAGKK